MYDTKFNVTRNKRTTLFNVEIADTNSSLYMGGEVMIVRIRWEPCEKPKRFVSPSEILLEISLSQSAQPHFSGRTCRKVDRSYPKSGAEPTISIAVAYLNDLSHVPIYIGHRI
jgi:hypothetical protein